MLELRMRLARKERENSSTEILRSIQEKWCPLWCVLSKVIGGQRALWTVGSGQWAVGGFHFSTLNNSHPHQRCGQYAVFEAQPYLQAVSVVQVLRIVAVPLLGIAATLSKPRRIV